MDKVISQRLRTNVFIYLDDLLIITPDFATHVRILKEVAECFKAANSTIGINKSNVWFKEIKYLGFILGKDTLRTDLDKVTAVLNMKLPRSVKKV